MLHDGMLVANRPPARPPTGVRVAGRAPRPGTGRADSGRSRRRSCRRSPQARCANADQRGVRRLRPGRTSRRRRSGHASPSIANVAANSASARRASRDGRRARPRETAVDRDIPQHAVAIAQDVVGRRPVVGRRQRPLVAERRIEHVGDVHQLVTEQRAQRLRLEQRRRPQPQRQQRPASAVRVRRDRIDEIGAFVPRASARADTRPAATRPAMSARSCERPPRRRDEGRGARTSSGAASRKPRFAPLGVGDVVDGDRAPAGTPGASARRRALGQQDGFLDEIGRVGRCAIMARR